MGGFMVDRTRPRAALRRANVPWRVYDMIVRKTCLHVDAWLFQASDDQLYFAFLTSAGGTQEISRTMYRAEPGGLVPVAFDPDALNQGVQRHIDSPWARRHAPWLAGIHWSVIAPTLRQPIGEPFKGHRSIVLNYVYSDPRIDDPLDGIENMYAVTGRKARDDAQRTTPERPAKVVEDAPAWGARDRSVLRTLGKLLA